MPACSPSTPLRLVVPPHCTQRISAAIITGDARHSLERLNGLKGEATRAAARRRPGGHHRRTAAAAAAGE